MPALKNDYRDRYGCARSALSCSQRRVATAFGDRVRSVRRLAALIAVLGVVVGLRAAPVVTRENFNELGSAYQQALNNTNLTGLPVGISANFSWNCQLLWSPGVNPPGSTATNSIQVGWTPAVPAVSFNKPVVLWSLAVFKQWSNTVSLVGKLKGRQVWSYTNGAPASGAWFTVTSGTGHPIDELDVDCAWWSANLTDFTLSDATGIVSFTNSSPYYVDGTNSAASDYNPGTEALPWKTYQWAAAALRPGDTVYIKAGTYAGDLVPANSGTPNGWITYSAYPGHEQRVVLDHAGVLINQKSCIKISGLKVQYPQDGTSGTGIYVLGPGGNYIISGNYTYDTTSSGIAVWGVPWQSDPGIYNYIAVTNVLIQNNTIEKACDGGWGEQLDIVNGVDGFEVCGNLIKNGTNAWNGGEGIDCKEGASNGKIWGNEVYNIRRYGFYLEAGGSDPSYYKIRPGILTNIEVYNNVIHNNDSHGIGITSEGRGNIDGIKVCNNICYSNGADGILLYDYNYPSTENYARNISIINNTTYNNNTSTNTPYYGGIATDHHYAQNVVVRNNIAYETVQHGFGIKQPANPATVMDHNISTAVNPGFVNVAQANFHLKTNSPAVNTGSPAAAPTLDFDGSARPCGPGYDMGAFEYIPALPVSIKIQRQSGQSNVNILLQGGPQAHYRVDWKPTLNAATWTSLQEIPVLPRSPYALSDTNPVSMVAQRYYRAVLLTP